MKKNKTYNNESIRSLKGAERIRTKPEVIHTFIEQVKTEEAKKGIEMADKLIDMYLFHSRVYESGMIGMKKSSL